MSRLATMHVAMLAIVSMLCGAAVAAGFGPDDVKRGPAFADLSSKCWSTSASSLCVGDLSQREGVAQQDSVGFSLHTYPEPTAAAAASGVASSLVGFWDFEDIYAQDGSGNNNAFLEPVPAAGPGFLRGASGLFSGQQTHMIPHIDAYAAPAATVAMWVYALGDAHDGFRSLLLKGMGASTGAEGRRDALSLKVWPGTRQLRLTVGADAILDSKAALALRRWTHVAVTVDASGASLFVNGQFDSSTAFKPDSSAAKALQGNTDPIYVASSPSTNVLGLHAYIDKLEWRNAVVPATHIAASAGAALAGVPGGAQSVTLGCTACTRADADKACAAPPVVEAAQQAKPRAVAMPKKWHVCTRRELASSALLVARAMGWFSLAHAGKHSVFDLENSVKIDRGVALCCMDD